MNQKTIRFTLRTMTVSTLILAFASLAQAIPQAFVSTSGSDANPCTRAQPCRFFQRGVNVVDPGGEVIALTSGGYSRVTINKSVTISGEGVYAGFTGGPGETGVTINNLGAVVTLRSLSINGLSGQHGIDFQAGTALHVENCVISGFALNGINFDPTANNVVASLFVEETVIKNCGSHGIRMITSNSLTGINLKGLVDHCRFENNNIGISVNADPVNPARMTIFNSDISNNGVGGGGPGIQALNTSQVFVDSCTVANNFSGLSNAFNAVMYVANTFVTNSIGAGISAGTPTRMRTRSSAGGPTNTVEGSGTIAADFGATYAAK